MPLSIKDPNADRLAREVAHYTGETITQAVMHALEERLARCKKQTGKHEHILAEEVLRLAEHCANLPLLDERSDDDILGYDENGIPK